jgi:hypothetical protein
MNAAVTAVLEAGFSMDELKEDVGDYGDGGYGIDGLLVEFNSQKELWEEVVDRLEYFLDSEIRYFSGGFEDSEPQGEG